MDTNEEIQSLREQIKQTEKEKQNELEKLHKMKGAKGMGPIVDGMVARVNEEFEKKIKRFHEQIDSLSNRTMSQSKPKRTPLKKKLFSKLGPGSAENGNIGKRPDLSTNNAFSGSHTSIDGHESGLETQSHQKRRREVDRCGKTPPRKCKIALLESKKWKGSDDSFIASETSDNNIDDSSFDCETSSDKSADYDSDSDSDESVDSSAGSEIRDTDVKESSEDESCSLSSSKLCSDGSDDDSNASNGGASFDDGKEYNDDNGGDCDDKNQDYCFHCKRRGDLVCCDGGECDRSYHAACLKIDVENLGDKWYCPRCDPNHEVDSSSQTLTCAKPTEGSVNNDKNNCKNVVDHCTSNDPSLADNIHAPERNKDDDDAIDSLGNQNNDKSAGGKNGKSLECSQNESDHEVPFSPNRNGEGETTRGEDSVSGDDNEVVGDNAMQNEEDYDEEYRHDEEEELERIRKSKLTMAIQGLRSMARGSKSKNQNKLGVREPDALDRDSLEHSGKIYCKGRCYHVKLGGEESDDSATVGVNRFHRGSKGEVLAECVLVWRFEDTFLGIEEDDANYTVDYIPSPFVKVEGEIFDLMVSDLEQASDTDSIPELTYIPQVDSNRCHFGYYWDKMKRRRGQRKVMRVLELFCGGGGMHLGYEKAGFITAMAVDYDKSAIDTLKFNNRGVATFQGDVHEFLNIIRTPVGKKMIGPIDHLHVSPPCQGFSGANRNGGVNDKRNNDLSLCILEAVQITKCTTAVFENVTGMWKRRHIHYLKKICSGLMKLGYQVRVEVLRASDYGDPQIRPRIIIFASHKSAPPPIMPPKTHGNEADLIPFVTVGDAIGTVSQQNDLQNMGCNMTSLTPGEHGVVRLDPDSLAPAIRASSQPFHPAEDRLVNVREAALLQSFPRDYFFCGNIKSQFKQVGNAVPVEFAIAIAHSVRRVITYNYEENE